MPVDAPPLDRSRAERSAQRTGLLLPDATVIQVLVVAAVLIVLGPGRTKYVEAVAELGDSKPLGDRLTKLRQVIAGRLPLRQRPKPQRRTHLAVIELLSPSPLTVIAGGSQQACTAALEAWIHEHGLPAGARGWVLRCVAETVLEPGVAIYTVPVAPPPSRQPARPE